MLAGEIPQELIDILDDRAGKKHSRTGSVVACLAEILTRWEEIRPQGTDGYPTAWTATAHKMTETDYRGVIERRLSEVRAQSKRCQHRHRTREAARRCATRSLASEVGS